MEIASECPLCQELGRTIVDLQDEVSQLKEAMKSRAVIEQAKGMVMAESHCSADEAFQLLVRLSNNTNVKLNQVASAMVYQATKGRT